MLTTFLRLPFFSSGRKARVTLCTPVTLIFRIPSRSVLAQSVLGSGLVGQPGCEHILNTTFGDVKCSSIVDEYIKTLPAQRLGNLGGSCLDCLLIDDVQLDKLDAAAGFGNEFLQCIILAAGRCEDLADFRCRFGSDCANTNSSLRGLLQ